MDDKNAPYNEVEHSDEELEIFVSVVISKTIKVKVSDYTIVDAGIDENRIPYVIKDYSTCDIKEAVRNKLGVKDFNLTNFELVGSNPDNIEDTKNWRLDDIDEVILNKY